MKLNRAHQARESLRKGRNGHVRQVSSMRPFLFFCTDSADDRKTMRPAPRKRCAGPCGCLRGTHVGRILESRASPVAGIQPGFDGSVRPKNGRRRLKTRFPFQLPLLFDPEPNDAGGGTRRSGQTDEGVGSIPRLPGRASEIRRLGAESEELRSHPGPPRWFARGLPLGLRRLRPWMQRE